jgi:hypothetical protein
MIVVKIYHSKPWIGILQVHKQPPLSLQSLLKEW